MVYLQLFEHWRKYSLNKSWEIIWSIFFNASNPTFDLLSLGLKKKARRVLIMKYNWHIIHFNSFGSEKLMSLLVIKTQTSNAIFDIFFRKIVNILVIVTVTVKEMAM